MSDDSDAQMVASLSQWEAGSKQVQPAPPRSASTARSHASSRPGRRLVASRGSNNSNNNSTNNSKHNKGRPPRSPRPVPPAAAPQRPLDATSTVSTASLVPQARFHMSVGNVYNTRVSTDAEAFDRAVDSLNASYRGEETPGAGAGAGAAASRVGSHLGRSSTRSHRRRQHGAAAAASVRSAASSVRSARSTMSFAAQRHGEIRAYRKALSEASRFSGPRSTGGGSSTMRSTKSRASRLSKRSTNQSPAAASRVPRLHMQGQQSPSTSGLGAVPESGAPPQWLAAANQEYAKVLDTGRRSSARRGDHDIITKEQRSSRDLTQPQRQLASIQAKMFDKLDKESVAGRQGVRLVELFRGMKPDAFGQVSHEDFCRGLVRDFKLTPHEAQYMYRLADDNDNGTIDCGEFKSLFDNIAAAAPLPPSSSWSRDEAAKRPARRFRVQDNDEEAARLRGDRVWRYLHPEETTPWRELSEEQKQEHRDREQVRSIITHHGGVLRRAFIHRRKNGDGADDDVVHTRLPLNEVANLLRDAGVEMTTQRFKQLYGQGAGGGRSSTGSARSQQPPTTITYSELASQTDDYFNKKGAAAQQGIASAGKRLVLPGMVGNLRPKPDFLYHYDAKGRAGNIVRDQPPDLPSPLRSAVLRHAAHELAGGSAAAVAAAAGAVTSKKSNNQGSVASSMRRPPSPIAAGKASSLKRELAEDAREAAVPALSHPMGRWASKVVPDAAAKITHRQHYAASVAQANNGDIFTWGAPYVPSPTPSSSTVGPATASVAASFDSRARRTIMKDRHMFRDRANQVVAV